MTNETQSPGGPATDNIEDMDKYILYGKGEIIQKLRILAKSKSLITAYFGGGKFSLLTAVIDVLRDKDLVVLDYGADEKTNRRLLDSERMVFKTQHQGITAQFSADKINKAKFQSRATFAIPIPETLLWVQRRELYRVKVPLSTAAKCRIRQTEDRSLELDILDISAGGISLRDTLNRVPDEPDTVLENCQIALPEFGEFTSSLRICNRLPLDATNAEDGNRIGCAFTQLGRDADVIIQRFIHHVDSLRKRIDS